MSTNSIDDRAFLVPSHKFQLNRHIFLILLDTLSFSKHVLETSWQAPSWFKLISWQQTASWLSAHALMVSHDPLCETHHWLSLDFALLFLHAYFWDINQDYFHAFIAKMFCHSDFLRKIFRGYFEFYWTHVLVNFQILSIISWSSENILWKGLGRIRLFLALQL